MSPAGEPPEPAPPPEHEPRIPATIITGFLGSGKTTLLNHILSQPHGRRVAVLINEFGDVDIDEDLVVSADRDVVALTNGCICCSVSDGLVAALERLLCRTDSFDLLVIETTGIADPVPVAVTFMRPEFAPRIRLDSIICLADAEHFAPDRFEDPAAGNQLRYADAVLLNKCDLVDARRLDSVEAEIRSMNPQARILRTERSRVAIPLILGIGGADLKERSRDHTATGSSHPFHYVAFSTSAPIDPYRFQAVLESMPTGIFRAKGFLHLAGVEPVHVFHLVGGRFTLEEAPGAARRTQLVFIGTEFDGDALRGRLQACAMTHLA